MARELVWTEVAAEDLHEIAEYIARDSMMYAATFVEDVRAASRSLGPSLAERMRRIVVVSMTATAAAIGWVAFADDVMTRACRTSVLSLFRASAVSRPLVDVPSLPSGEAAEARADAEDPVPSLEQYRGWSRFDLRSTLGTPVFADMRADYMKLDDHRIVRFAFVEETVVAVLDCGVESVDERRPAARVSLGTRCDELSAKWGLPEYGEPGAWFYAGDDSGRGILVFFEGGSVIGTQDLPAYWIIPPRDWRE
jgi:hypothetical protein